MENLLGKFSVWTAMVVCDQTLKIASGKLSVALQENGRFAEFRNEQGYKLIVPERELPQEKSFSNISTREEIEMLLNLLSKLIKERFGVGIQILRVEKPLPLKIWVKYRPFEELREEEFKVYELCPSGNRLVLKGEDLCTIIGLSGGFEENIIQALHYIEDMGVEFISFFEFSSSRFSTKTIFIVALKKHFLGVVASSV